MVFWGPSFISVPTVGPVQLDFGCRMIWACLPSLFGLGLEDSHIPTVWLLLYGPRIRPLSKVSHVRAGLKVELEPSHEWPGARPQKTRAFMTRTPTKGLPNLWKRPNQLGECHHIFQLPCELLVQALRLVTGDRSCTRKPTGKHIEHWFEMRANNCGVLAVKTLRVQIPTYIVI